MVDQTSSDDCAGDLPPVFLTYLEHRLGTSREGTLAMLGEWLLTYEPGGHRAMDVRKTRAAEGAPQDAAAARRGG